MSNQLYTTRDVRRCYPWIDDRTLAHRIASGHLKLTNPSPGSGIPHLFTFPELVHCAVLDELSCLGALSKGHRKFSLRKGGGRVGNDVWQWPFPEIPAQYYTDKEYRVFVHVLIVHLRFPGQEPPGVQLDSLRSYAILYSGLPELADTLGAHTQAFISVRPFYEIAHDALGMVE